jgi:hypothetical protein
MSRIAVFPEALLAKDKQDEVILFLQQLPAPARAKKEALVDWCKYVGVALTREMVEILLGPLAEEVR